MSSFIVQLVITILISKWFDCTLGYCNKACVCVQFVLSDAGSGPCRHVDLTVDCWNDRLCYKICSHCHQVIHCHSAKSYIAIQKTGKFRLLYLFGTKN